MVNDTEQTAPDDFRRFREGQRLIDEFAFAKKGSPRFIAVDVETANADLSSICQVAAVSFVGVRVVNVWQSLVDPEDFFEPFNVSLHGIDQAAVERAPRFPEILTELSSLLTGATVASHTAFDRVALAGVYKISLLSKLAASLRGGRRRAPGRQEAEAPGRLDWVPPRTNSTSGDSTYVQSH